MFDINGFKHPLINPFLTSFVKRNGFVRYKIEIVFSCICQNNTFGFIISKITSNYFILARVVSIYPFNINCNVSSTIELQCFLNLNDSSNWTNMWLHSIKGNSLEARSGITLGNKSTLTIAFCDFRDIGDYTCTWSSNNKIYSSTYPATVAVFGKKIFTTFFIGIFVFHLSTANNVFVN